MENVDISGGVKNIIRFGLTGLILLSAAIGYGVYNHYHGEKNIQIDNAKVTGTMVSVRALVNGKIQELSFTDGDEVQAGENFELNIVIENTHLRVVVPQYGLVDAHCFLVVADGRFVLLCMLVAVGQCDVGFARLLVSLSIYFCV